jgi:hypothetical protein
VMRRDAMRGFMILLALIFAFASAGTVLCETNCAAGASAASGAGMPDGSEKVATSHCDGEQTDASRQDAPVHHRNSGGNTKHDGAHSHLRIVATASAEVQVSPALTFSNFAATPVNFGAALFARVEQNSWNNNSSPPLKSSSVFSTGVLRI